MPIGGLMERVLNGNSFLEKFSRLMVIPLTLSGSYAFGQTSMPPPSSIQAVYPSVQGPVSDRELTEWTIKNYDRFTPLVGLAPQASVTNLDSLASNGIRNNGKHGKINEDANFCNTVWHTFTIGSIHIPNNGYNQFNPGYGLECALNDVVRLNAGGYINSKVRSSLYWGGDFLPVKLGTLPIEFGNALGGVGIKIVWGYNKKHRHRPSLLPHGVATVEGKEFGSNFIFGSYKGKAVIGFQLKKEM